MNFPDAKVGECFWRIKSYLVSTCLCDEPCGHRPDVRIRPEAWFVEKITPKGIWFSSSPAPAENEISCLSQRKWVTWLGNGKTKFACRELSDAYRLFIAKRTSMCWILQGKLENAEKAIRKARIELANCGENV